MNHLDGIITACDICASRVFRNYFVYVGKRMRVCVRARVCL